ncbi:hypothetical protein AGMMS49965_01830 [Bacteroidia bacterium]|nr:hypothetical protein AGMMS49965_01830 [Bacteroidia bacterium]
MKTTLNSPEDTDAILKYIAKDLSWRKLYFSKFTIGQKILFFVPPFFIPLPIYGMGLLLEAHLWIASVVCGMLVVVPFWAFAKQKMAFEKKVFEKYYQSDTCKSMLDFELEKFALFLGEQNTFENRLFWLDYFKKKLPGPFPQILTPMVIFGGLQFAFYQKPVSALKYFWTSFAFLFLLISFALIKPAITDFKFRAEAINGALKLIGELDYRAL